METIEDTGAVPVGVETAAAGPEAAADELELEVEVEVELVPEHPAVSKPAMVSVHRAVSERLDLMFDLD